jgi:hypothetical protein
MILAGDHDLPGLQILDRVVGPVVAELHFHRPRPGRQGQELVAEADAEDRYAAGEDLADGGDGVVAGFRVAGTVGKEHPVRLLPEDLGGGRLGRHHRHPAATRGEHAQDVVLDAKVIGDDVQTGRRCSPIAAQVQGPPFHS